MSKKILYERVGREEVECILDYIKREQRKLRASGERLRIDNKNAYWSYIVDERGETAGRVLISYNTPIMVLVGGYLLFSEVSYSRTTSNHFNEYEGLYRDFTKHQASKKDFSDILGALGLYKGEAAFYGGVDSDYYPDVTKRWEQVGGQDE